MKKTFLQLLFICLGTFAGGNTFAQCDTIANTCNKHMKSPFLSDGQEYRALLIDQEVAEFSNTFYGGSTYRVSACSGFSDGNLVFRIFDTEKHLLFTNADHKNAPFWDFKFASTVNCIIEAQLSPASTVSNGGETISGCAVLLIGFKN